MTCFTINPQNKSKQKSFNSTRRHKNPVPLATQSNKVHANLPNIVECNVATPLPNSKVLGSSRLLCYMQR